MDKTEKAIASLKKYTTTPWEEGGPGESVLVDEIRTVLKEMDVLKKALSRQTGHCKRHNTFFMMNLVGSVCMNKRQIIKRNHNKEDWADGTTNNNQKV